MSDWQEQRERRDSARRAEVMSLPVLPARFQAALSAEDGEVRVCASVGPQGQVVALWSRAGDRPALTPATEQPGWATFPDPVASRPVPVRVSVHDPDPVTAALIPELTVGHVTVQPLPSGRFLIVGARSRWRPDGPDRNAVIYDGDGRVVAQAVLGDGIEHAFAASDGHVWVGYFDEGVYGNFGWGRPGGDPPVGACGLARFSPGLRRDWQYPSHVDQPWGAISDCYALNVTDTDVWACYYTGWPVVRIRDGAVTSWAKHRRGSPRPGGPRRPGGPVRRARPDQDRLVTGQLTADGVQVTGEYRVVLPGGRPIPARTQVIGRGACLHFLTADSWYRLALTDIPASPGAAGLGEPGRK